MHSKLIKSFISPGISEVNFDGLLTDDYLTYKVLINGLSVNLSSTTLGMRNGNGANYSADAKNYDYTTRWYSPSTTDTKEDSQQGVTIISLSGMELSPNSQFVNSLEITLVRSPNDGYISTWWDGILENSDGTLNRVLGGGNSLVNNLDSVQFVADNTDTSVQMNGTFSVYGITT